MLFDPYVSFLESLAKAWKRDDKRVRAAILLAVASTAISILIALLAQSGLVDKKITNTVAGIIGALAGIVAVGVSAYKQR